MRGFKLEECFTMVDVAYSNIMQEEYAEWHRACQEVSNSIPSYQLNWGGLGTCVIGFGHEKNVINPPWKKSAKSLEFRCAYFSMYY